MQQEQFDPPLLADEDSDAQLGALLSEAFAEYMATEDNTEETIDRSSSTKGNEEQTPSKKRTRENCGDGATTRNDYEPDEKRARMALVMAERTRSHELALMNTMEMSSADIKETFSDAVVSAMHQVAMEHLRELKSAEQSSAAHPRATDVMDDFIDAEIAERVRRVLQDERTEIRRHAYVVALQEAFSILKSASKILRLGRITGDILGVCNTTHACLSFDTCHPMSEDAMRGKILKKPGLAAKYSHLVDEIPIRNDIFVCKYQWVHVCNNMCCNHVEYDPTSFSMQCTLTGTQYDCYDEYSRVDPSTWGDFGKRGLENKERTRSKMSMHNAETMLLRGPSGVVGDLPFNALRDNVKEMLRVIEDELVPSMSNRFSRVPNDSDRTGTYASQQDDKQSVDRNSNNEYALNDEKKRRRRQVPQQQQQQQRREKKKKKTLVAITRKKETRKVSQKTKKHHKLGLMQPSISTAAASTETQEDRIGRAMSLFKEKMDLLNSAIRVEYIHDDGTGPVLLTSSTDDPKGTDEGDDDTWDEDKTHMLYLGFLKLPLFQRIIRLEEGREQTLVDKEMLPYEHVPESMRYVWEAAIEVVRSFCPGLLRLKVLFKDLVKLAKKREKMLRDKIARCAEQGVLVDDSDPLAQPIDYKSYPLVLHERMTDIEVLRCADIMVHFWQVCLDSPYCKSRNTSPMNPLNHCIAMMRELIRGRSYAGQEIIPRHPKFARRGFVINFNCISKYGYLRKQHRKGGEYFHNCLRSVLKTRPIVDILYRPSETLKRAEQLVRDRYAHYAKLGKPPQKI